MEVIFVLIPVSVIIVAVMIWFFIWAVDHGQYEDVDRAAANALSETDTSAAPTQSENNIESHPATAETPELGR